MNAPRYVAATLALMILVGLAPAKAHAEAPVATKFVSLFQSVVAWAWGDGGYSRPTPVTWGSVKRRF